MIKIIIYILLIYLVVRFFQIVTRIAKKVNSAARKSPPSPSPNRVDTSQAQNATFEEIKKDQTP